MGASIMFSTSSPGRRDLLDGHAGPLAHGSVGILGLSHFAPPIAHAIYRFAPPRSLKRSSPPLAFDFQMTSIFDATSSRSSPSLARDSLAQPEFSHKRQLEMPLVQHQLSNNPLHHNSHLLSTLFLQQCRTPDARVSLTRPELPSRYGLHSVRLSPR